MKLIISVDPVRFPLTGIGRYTYELALRLQVHRELSELRFFAGSRFLPALPVASDQSDGVYSLKRIVQNSTLAMEAFRLLMPLLRRRTLKGLDDYLYHGPNFFIPPFPGRCVATFHDLSPFIWTQCHTPQRICYWQKEMRKALERADALITDSEFTRRELAKYFAWPLERIHTVPLASSAEFHPRHEDELRGVLACYGLVAGGYSLFVGTVEPRKNIGTLLDAYSRLPLPVRQKWPLVLIGYRGWRNEAIHRRIAQAQTEGWARYLGFVPAGHLPRLFSGARLFAFPSLYEGFGLPVLEAMASGVPVICSNSSSLPEVAGNAALVCEALDVDALSLLIQRGLQDDTWRARARQAGLRQASEFSWDLCASRTLQVYRSVLGAT